VLCGEGGGRDVVKYKTCVTDYEGMQAALDTHVSQGWRLFSITPDTWRRSIVTLEGDEAPFEGLSGSSSGHEYSASYYLLVFQREEYLDEGGFAAMAEKELPRYHEE